MAKVQDITKKQMKNLTGNYYMGFSDYRRGKIYILKTLSNKVKKETILHERGHFVFRKRRPYIGKKLKQEIKRTPLYSDYKKDYKHKPNKIPEELLVQLRAEVKSGRMNKQQIGFIRKQYPYTFKKLRSIL